MRPEQDRMPALVFVPQDRGYKYDLPSPEWEVQCWCDDGSVMWVIQAGDRASHPPRLPTVNTGCSYHDTWHLARPGHMQIVGDLIIQLGVNTARAVQDTLSVMIALCWMGCSPDILIITPLWTESIKLTFTIQFWKLYSGCGDGQNEWNEHWLL